MFVTDESHLIVSWESHASVMVDLPVILRQRTRTNDQVLLKTVLVPGNEQTIASFGSGRGDQIPGQERAK
jgi:hypothetical protein